MFILWNSLTGRPSSNTTLSLRASISASWSALTRGVWYVSSASSPKVFEGRFTPAKST
ncbi:hypothetical protein QF040_003278 [Variovorax sp. W2I14]